MSESASTMGESSLPEPSLSSTSSDSSAAPVPSSSGSSESSLSSLLSLSSGSSASCSVSIVTADIHYDRQGNLEPTAKIELNLIGCDASHATATIEIVPLAANPQNERNSPLWTIIPDPDNKPLKWIAIPTWYGSGPSNLCYGYSAPFRISAVVSCPHCACFASKDVQVQLEPFNDEMLPKVTPEGVAQTDPVEFLTSIGLFRQRVQILDFTKNAQVRNRDHFSQYRLKIRIEENFHAMQWLDADGAGGSAGREMGGCGDLYTGKGLRYWLPYIGNGPLYFYGNTAAEAEQEAVDFVIAGVTKEMTYSAALFDARECYREQKAKQKAEFREAFTLICAYPPCTPPPFPNPTHIAWQ